MNNQNPLIIENTINLNIIRSYVYNNLYYSGFEEFKLKLLNFIGNPEAKTPKKLLIDALFVATVVNKLVFKGYAPYLTAEKNEFNDGFKFELYKLKNKLIEFAIKQRKKVKSLKIHKHCKGILYFQIGKIQTSYHCNDSEYREFENTKIIKWNEKPNKFGDIDLRGTDECPTYKKLEKRKVHFKGGNIIVDPNCTSQRVFRFFKKDVKNADTLRAFFIKNRINYPLSFVLGGLTDREDEKEADNYCSFLKNLYKKL